MNQDELVIVCSQDNSSPWDTEQDSGSESSTSTPDYKRGRHPEQAEQYRPLRSQALTAIARDEILHEGIKLKKAPRWMRKRRVPTTIILSDGYFQRWPQKDTKCVVVMEPSYDLWKWSAVIKSRELRLHTYFNIILCLQKLYKLEGPPLTNSLQALARAIKSANPECRLFIANLPPSPQSSPVLGKRISSFNEELLQAVINISRRMNKIHHLSIYEHLIDSTGKLLSPVKYYFRSDDQLTKVGCALVRDFIMREAGMKTYWFDESRRSRDISY